jgi:hypothetical protein
LAIVLGIIGCNNTPPNSTTMGKKVEVTTETTVNVEKNANYRIIHIFVALCDNEHQGIVKVPPKIGNGKDPDNNLYWGCDLGTNTFLKRDKNWQLVKTLKMPRDKVLERCIFKHKSKAVYAVADAYDGEHIKLCTTDLLESCAGQFNDYFVIAGDSIACGGKADLLGYIGHNGFMDFELKTTYAPKDSLTREAIILGCRSEYFFKPYLAQTGAKPLLWTTGLMAPEAYSLAAAMDGWIHKKDKPAIHEAAAQAYHKYQNCGIKAARNLFLTD